MNAAEFLQAVPHGLAATGFPDDFLGHEHAVQDVRFIDHEQIRNRIDLATPLAADHFCDRLHFLGPVFLGNAGEMIAVACVERHKVDQRKRGGCLDGLAMFILIDELADGPVTGRLWVLFEREACGPVGSAGRIEGEHREQARFAGSGGDQVRWDGRSVRRVARIDAEDRGSGIFKAALHLCAHLHQAGSGRLQDKNAEAHGHARQLLVAQGEGHVAVLDDRLFENIVALHENLERQVGRENLGERALFLTRKRIGVQADQVVGEERQRFRIKPVFTEGVEQRVVACFTVFAFDFEFSHGDGASQFNGFGQPVAVGLECGIAGVEGEGVGRGAGAGFADGRGEELLRLQRRDQPEDALAATLGKRIANRDFLQDRRHGVEVEMVERARAEGIAQTGCTLGRVGIDVVGLDDVGKLQHQAIEVFIEAPGAAHLGNAPGMAEEM